MKKLVIIIDIVVVVLTAAYFTVVGQAADRYLPNTSINDLDISWKTPGEVAPLITPEVTSFTVTSRQGDEIIDLADIGFEIVITPNAQDVLDKQNKYAWPAHLFKDTAYTTSYEYTYSEELLREVFENLECVSGDSVIAPENSVIKQDADGHYYVSEAVWGNTLKKEKAFAEISTAISLGLKSVEITEDCYEAPTVFSDDPELNEKVALYKVIGEETITIELVDAQEILDPERLLDFFSPGENGEIIINEDKLAEFQLYLEDEYQTYMLKRPFMTSDGQLIEVGGAEKDGIALDTYGFWMARYATRSIIRNAILSKESQTIEPYWNLKGNCRDDFNMDLGDSYIEISLEKQHLWFYMDGELILETDVVTGLDSNPVRQTPTGVYGIWERGEKVYLAGEMDEETWYSYVDYWMATTWTGIGLHNAPWRSRFGGDIYKTDGSHGCINVDFDSGKTIYEMTDLNFPVVVY